MVCMPTCNLRYWANASPLPVTRRGDAALQQAQLALVRNDKLGHAVNHLEGLALGFVKSNLAHTRDDLLRAETQAISVHGHVLKSPKGTESWAIETVVHHEVVHEEAAARAQGLECVGIKPLDDRLGHRSGDVGHQHDVEGLVADWPLGARGIELHEVDPLADLVGLLCTDLLACAAHLRQFKHCGLEARRCAHKDVGESTGAATHVQHVTDSAKLQLLLYEVLRCRNRAIVLCLCVSLSDLRVREPGCIARGLPRDHDLGQCAHPMVELAANLELQVVPVEMPRGCHHVLGGVGGQRVHPLGAPPQALHRCQSSQERRHPGCVATALLPQSCGVHARSARGGDLVKNAELESCEERLRRHESIGNAVQVNILTFLPTDS
mmetsp:Transcript_99671/g.257739  ORF Transcript_99671/g.257739 Transcript_99671/m.257739 type:complete len:380 (-) Transcript_99671:225-1364(-)